MKTSPIKRDEAHIPIRTCISCRAKRDKRELSRLILDDQGLVAQDGRGKGKGRGAYVCPEKSCLEMLARGTRLSRAFRKKGHLNLHPDLEQQREEISPAGE